MAVYDDSVYRMWYAGHEGSGVMSIGYATSTDGVAWTKFIGNPVLVPGGAGDWYEGAQSANILVGLLQTGYARSFDGVNWTKDANNPVLAVGGLTSWDRNAAIVTQVLNDGGTYRTWYGGTDIVTAFGARLATLTAVTLVEHSESIPSAYQLEQNFPNPFNPETGIEYSLPTGSLVTLTVFNVLGHEVRTLVHDDRDAGWYSVLWDGTNDLNRPESSGVYFYRMTARSSSDGSHAVSRFLKMVLIR